MVLVSQRKVRSLFTGAFAETRIITEDILGSCLKEPVSLLLSGSKLWHDMQKNTPVSLLCLGLKVHPTSPSDSASDCHIPASTVNDEESQRIGMDTEGMHAKLTESSRICIPGTGTHYFQQVLEGLW